MNKSQANIIIISLNEDFGRLVSKSLAKELSMDYVDCKDKITEDIAKNNILTGSFTMNDLEQQQERVLAACLQMENCVISLPYNLYRRNQLLFDGQAIYYLKLNQTMLSEKDIISAVSFTTRDEYLKRNASVVIRLSGLDEKEAIQKVKGEIK